MTSPAEPDDTRPLRRAGAKAVWKFALLLLVVVAGFAALRWTPLSEHLEPQRAVEALRALAAEPWAPLALVGAYVLLVPFGVPVTPILIAGGLVFGFWWGSVLNFAGTFLAGAVNFYLGRLLGKDFFEQLFGPRLRRIEAMVERHGFWTLLRIRFVPIPYTLVNYAAAVAGVRPATFLGATALGLAPSITVFTYFAVALLNLADRPEESGPVILQLAVAMVLLLALTFLPQFIGRSSDKAGRHGRSSDR